MSEWNDYIWPLIITDRPETMTLPVGLTRCRTPRATATARHPDGRTVLVIVPMLLIFAALQRYIVAGLAQGASRVTPVETPAGDPLSRTGIQHSHSTVSIIERIPHGIES